MSERAALCKSSPIAAIRRWRRYKRAGVVLIPGRLTWWRATPRWGWGRDDNGRVFDLGRLRYYPKDRA